jgi:hypothetical protein
VSPLRRRYRHVPLARPEPEADPALEGARSEERCPACGRHTVTLLGFPHVATMGVQLYSEMLGMGELRPDQPPGIACLSCGAQWRDLDAFREAAESAPAARPTRRGSLGEPRRR